MIPRFTRESVQVGQTLLMSGLYADRPKEVTVVKVGRTIITVDLNGIETKFDMVTGHGKRDYRFRLGAVEQYEDDLRRDEIRKELKKYLFTALPGRRYITTSY